MHSDLELRRMRGPGSRDLTLGTDMPDLTPTFKRRLSEFVGEVFLATKSLFCHTLSVWSL